MVRKEIFNQLGGYDEELSYEDFDFWVRASRIALFGFLNERLTAIRKHETSMSTGWYKHGDRQLLSTYHVCIKILKLCKNDKERQSLEIRARYELRQSVFSGNKKEAKLFYELLKTLKKRSWLDIVMIGISKLNLPVAWIRGAYHQYRYS
jgi:hypothetical protein